VIQKWLAPGAREKLILDTAIADATRYGSKFAVKVYTEQEPGSGGKESAQSTINNLSKHGYSIKRDLPSGDKDIRLEPFAAQAQLGNVYMVTAPWNEGYLDEMTAIPFSVRRDQGDSKSGAFNNLNKSCSTGTAKTTGLPGRGQKRTPLPRR